MEPSIITSVVLLPVVLVGAIAAAGVHDFGDLEVISAIEALENHDYAQAAELMESRLQGALKGKGRAEARLIAARASLGQEHLEPALAQLAGIEADLPEIADVVFEMRARILEKLGRWPDALVWWRNLAGSFPDSPLARAANYGIGDALFALQRPDEAESAYETALRTAPRSEREPIARLNLARIAEGRRRWPVAAAGYSYLANYRVDDLTAAQARERLEALIKAGHAKPPTVQQQLARIDLLLSSRPVGEVEAAIAAVRPVVDAVTRTAFSYRVAKLAYRQRDFDVAAQGFTELAATAVGRDRSEYEQWLARTYSTAGRYGDAIAAYLRIAERENAYGCGREALYKAAWLTYQSGDHSRAIELFERFVEKYPRDRSIDEARWYIAWNAYRLGDLATATRELVKLRTQHPASSLVQRSWYWQARFAMFAGDTTAARDALGRASADEPLSYYGLLAAQRLRELDASRQSVAFASLEMRDDETPGAELQGAPGELAAAAPAVDSDPTALPWDDAVLDWRSVPGKRFLCLVRLGLYDLAADSLAAVPTLAGVEHADAVYARARLLYGIGDYRSAYRLVELGFGASMRANPQAASRRYFRLAYPDAHPRVVAAAAQEFGISPLLILAVMRQESGFDERARSGASAHGLMQIIPPTAGKIAAALGYADYDDSMLREPAVNVRFGGWYLAQLLKKFDGNAVLACGSYNAGPAAVETWVNANRGRALDEFVEDIPFRETRHYVKEVMGHLAVYAWLYAGETIALGEAVPSTYLENVDF